MLLGYTLDIPSLVFEDSRIPHPLQLEEEFFADPDYSEFDCMDEPPDVVQCDSTQV